MHGVTVWPSCWVSIGNPVALDEVWNQPASNASFNNAHFDFL